MTLKKITSNTFALILGNNDLIDEFVVNVAQAVSRIDDNFNKRHEWSWMKIRFVKTVAESSRVLKIETSCYILCEDLADSIHEILPCHGIAVLNWSDYYK